MRGWRAALESMTVRMRLIVLDLTSVLDGCDAALMGPEYGVYYVLEPYVKKNARGNYYLASPKHRQLIQVSLALDLMQSACCRTNLFLTGMLLRRLHDRLFVAVSDAAAHLQTDAGANVAN